MHAAMGICVLLVGGWVFPGDAREDGSVSDGAAPAAKSFGPQFRESFPTPPINARGAAERPSPRIQERMEEAVEEGEEGFEEPAEPRPPERAPTREVPAITEIPEIPTAPTEPAAAPRSQIPPTGQVDPNAARRAAIGPGASPARIAPTLADLPPAPMTTYGPVATEGLGTGTLWQTPQTGGGDVQKPFAGYRPAPALSPYVRLDPRRRDNNDPGEQYFTLVRPFVEQRYLNQQFGGEIRNLQTVNRIQGTAIQQQMMRPAPMRTVPQFMNTGQYYPGFRQ